MQIIKRLKDNPIYGCIIAASSLIFAAALVYLFIFNPASGNYFPPCPFYYSTGYYCPGCGSLRGTHQLLHGNFLRALDLNPLMVLSIPFIIYLILSQYDIRFKGKKLLRRVYFSYKFYGVMLTIIMVYWVVRNIPVYPFTILAP